MIVEPLAPDLVTFAQCVALDADAFPYPSTDFAGALGGHGARVWVARESPGARILGFVAGHVARGALRVVGLAVDRAHRRRGLARLLVRAALEDARRAGTREIVLQVSTTNAGAIALYESEGFVRRTLRRDYYAPGVYRGSRDAIEMARAIER